MSGIEGPGVVGGNAVPITEDVVTVTDETATLPNSRALTAGTNVTLSTATPGQLIVSASGSGSTVPTTIQGDTLFASAANTLSALAKDTNATRYVANTGTSNNPAWAQVNVANGVTGTLPGANGGTGSVNVTFAGATAPRTFTLPDATTTVLTTNAAVTVPQGGTGIASGTSGGVPYFSATNTVASSGALTVGSVVLGGGAGAAPNVSANLLFSSTTLTLGDSTSGTIIAPAAATVTSAGSQVLIQGGPGGATSGTSGVALVRGGTSAAQGGSAQLTGGAGGANAAGGAALVTGGAGNGSGSGGSAQLVGGAGGATGNGNGVQLTGGAGGATSGNGGSITIQAGLPVEGNGGGISLSARNGVGTNRNGGDVVITTGTATGSGTAGTLQLTNCTTTGAQTATFTATNKPGVGTTAPSLWLRVVVGATTYYLPMWQ